MMVLSVLLAVSGITVNVLVLVVTARTLRNVQGPNGKTNGEMTAEVYEMTKAAEPHHHQLRPGP